MFKSGLFALTGVALALVIGRASVAAEPLGVGEAMALALTDQPLLASGRSAIDVAEQSAVAAAQLPDPKIGFGLSDLPVTGSEAFSPRRDNFTQFKVGVTQEFPRAEKRRLRGELGHLESERASQELDLAQRRVRREAALAWLDAYYPELAVKLIRDLQREARIQIDALNIAYRAGRTNQADVLAAEVELDLLQDRETEFAHLSEGARAGLARWIGTAAQRPLAEEFSELPAPPSLARLQQIVATHPHLNALEKQVEAARTEVALAREAYKPDWRLEASYGNRLDFPDFFSIQVGIDLPVFTKNRQDRGLASKLSLLDQSRSAREDALRAIEADVERFYADWRAAVERIARFDERILPQAEQRIEAARSVYKSGRGDLSAVLAGRRSHLDLMLKKLALQVDAGRALVQLHYFTE